MASRDTISRALSLDAVLLLSLLCPACASEETTKGDTGFQVMASIPTDGSEDVVDDVDPELRLNTAADSTACTIENILLTPVTGNTVLYELGYELSFMDEGRKIVVVPSEVLLKGYWYNLSVRSGSAGCEDTSGRKLAPFSASFYIP